MAAKAAGCVCIAVTTSFPAGKLYQAGADFAVDDLSLAPEIIEKL
jgi:phosphoglycolate phosphatase-like HAD superfamily hydrolase